MIIARSSHNARRLTSAAVAALLLVPLLASCGPIVQIGAKAPPAESLLLIEADAKPDSSQPARVSGPTVAVELPLLPAMLQTLRLAVRTSDNEIQYLVAASWAETPSRLVQRLLADTLTARGIAVIDRSQASSQADATLSGSLRDFTLDVRNPAAPVVTVRYDAQLGRHGTSRPISIRSFVATEPVSSENPVDVAAALSVATNRLAAELANWTGQSL